MVSFALFSVAWHSPHGVTQVFGAESIGIDCFTFRLTKQDAGTVSHKPDAVTLTFRGMQTKDSVTLKDFSVEWAAEDDYVLCHVITADPEAVALLKGLMRDIAQYEHLKNDCDDAALSAAYSSYPVEGERAFHPSFRSWRYDKLSALRADNQWLCALQEIPQLAATLCGEPAYTAFLDAPADAHWQALLKEAGLGEHPLSLRMPDMWYLGSITCARLLPSPTMLTMLIQQCAVQGLRPVLCLPPMADDDVTSFRTLLTVAAEQIGTEVIVNDPGVPLMAAEAGLADRLRFTAGPLMNRRRKDPRMRWWSGDLSLLRETSANSGSMIRLYRQLGIIRKEWEVCGYPIATDAGDSLRLPFYTVNTGSPCTLAAEVLTGDRGYIFTGDCRHACHRAAVMCGDSLDTVGIGNTLYGLDLRSLTDGAALMSFVRAGLDRLVVDLLQREALP